MFDDAARLLAEKRPLGQSFWPLMLTKILKRGKARDLANTITNELALLPYHFLESLICSFREKPSIDLFHATVLSI